MTMSASKTSGERLPAWLRRQVGGGQVREMKRALRGAGLHTVCEEARCPNIGECFARATATFLILGDVCTRRCAFCAVRGGVPSAVDPEEPARVAERVHAMGLRHAVITSVTRDDLPDGGAAHFAQTVAEVRRASPGTSVEVLIPDFLGSEAAIAHVCATKPDVVNHNIETVERVTPLVRDKASYRRSLAVLAAARRLSSGSIKSGLMVGLGETDREIEQTLRDLHLAGCDAVTIGQYLAPTKRALPVQRFVPPAHFAAYEAMGRAVGLAHVAAGPLVRSSYRADELLHGGSDSSIG
jgi:lipoyl synthase